MEQTEPAATTETTAECKAEGCQRMPTLTKSGRLPEFCDRHWKRVPRIVRDLLAQEFRPGQSENGTPGATAPSLEYAVAVRLAITCVIFHKNHGRPPPRSAIIKTQHELAAAMVVEVRNKLAEQAARRIELQEATNEPIPSIKWKELDEPQNQ